MDRVKNKGFELNDDFMPLRSYYKENDNTKKQEKPVIENYQRHRNTSRVPRKEVALVDDEEGDYELASTNNRANEQKKDMNAQVEDHIEHSLGKLDDDNLSIHQLYNKNLERLRYLNNVEDDVFNFGTKKGKTENYFDLDKRSLKDENIDEFLNKLNNI